MKTRWLAVMPFVAPDRRQSLLLGFAALCFSLASAAVIVGLLAQPVTFTLDAGRITPELGFSHVWLVPEAGSIYQLRSDSQRNPAVSTLEVFEDGLALGPAHSVHDNIRKLGRGRFSHWMGVVLFSSSDNSDPARNGKRYTVRATSTITRRVSAIGIAAFLAGATLVGVWVRLGTSTNSLRFRRGFAAVYEWYCRPTPLRARTAVSLLLAGGIASVAAVIVGWVVGGAAQSGLELARFFPLSDARANHSCGTSLAASGTLGPFAMFCTRRILYPSMLASLLPVLGWSAQNALIVQGLLTGLAATALALQLASLTSALAATTAALMLMVFVWEFTLGVFMTEIPGFAMGALGLCLLLAFAESKRSSWLFCGLAFLSIGMVARAGAVFVIPAALLWLVMAFWHDNRLRRFLLVAIVAAAVGPALQFAAVWVLGLDPMNSGGNFSTVVYGMSTGSRTWTEAYELFRTVFETHSEAEAFGIIYAAAFQNIRAQPGVFIQSLTASFSDYWRDFFAVGLLGQWSSLLLTIFAVGMMRAAICWRSSVAVSLLLILFLGEVVSAPLTGSVGIRVLAASIAIRFAICALGAQTVVDLAARALGAARSLPAAGADGTALPKLAATVGLFVVAMIVLPFVPLGRPRLQSVVPTGRCPAGTDEVISRIGQEAIMMTITKHGERLQSFNPVRISHQRLLEDFRYRTSWYGPDIERLPPPVTIMHAFDRSTERSMTTRFVAYEGVLDVSDEPRVLCIDNSRSVDLGAAKYAIIRDIQPLQP